MTTPRITALVIPADGTDAYLTAISATVSSMQHIVGGAVEAIGLTRDSVMYLHEEGKFIGLPINGNANRVVFLADPGLASWDFLVGPVVVTGALDSRGRNDGADHDVPASVLDLCLRAGLRVIDRTGNTPHGEDAPTNP